MSTDATAHNRRLWDRMAPSYDRAMRRCEPLMFGRDVRPLVCAEAGGDVLEVAIGTGLNLPYYPPGVRLTAVDLSPAMLAAARTRAADLGLAADLREAEAERLPFADASFDTVVATLSLCSVVDDRAAIAEMHRVLRPGGQLLLLDHVAATNPIVLALQRLLERFTVRTAGDYQTRHPLPLVERAGFTVRYSHRSKLGMVERLAAVKPAT
ncbi:class I SAM-dependent methyltransferase [Rugosimonospora africana]|uniref:Ubiquinone/menaquinone biosynthesis methyltransferase n=1 Tax=Rugosimonospora africana TaxID=556532 RepID=A0A8J3QTQ8_9ACTN|nr:class I SAM-dependent methyltransferase [Rugosimonospora africana]GIH16364.1 ubiquinone/menaquinone biosynthesis methyltransferase [Rugosimonospora africana]